ncbi:hypothetical protein V6N12_073997 [Hibiscus sabdariffa]|uniref:Uncharacterized protein n=1 Tax=Hibiscus sabdariffa TaxID=183260 RepID=A0ABR2AQJ4_9ROSI
MFCCVAATRTYVCDYVCSCCGLLFRSALPPLGVVFFSALCAWPLFGLGDARLRGLVVWWTSFVFPLLSPIASPSGRDLLHLLVGLCFGPLGCVIPIALFLLSKMSLPRPSVVSSSICIRLAMESWCATTRRAFGKDDADASVPAPTATAASGSPSEGLPTEVASADAPRPASDSVAASLALADRLVSSVLTSSLQTTAVTKDIPHDPMVHTDTSDLVEEAVEDAPLDPENSEMAVDRLASEDVSHDPMANSDDLVHDAITEAQPTVAKGSTIPPLRPHKRQASSSDPSKAKRSRPSTSSATRIPSMPKAGMSSVNNSSAKTARQSRREK